MTNSLAIQNNKLSIFQRLEMKKAYDQKLSGEFTAVIAEGFSDLGTGGTRKARQMRAVRNLLCGNKLAFSTISLLGLSDEVLNLRLCV